MAHDNAVSKNMGSPSEIISHYCVTLLGTGFVRKKNDHDLRLTFTSHSKLCTVKKTQFFQLPPKKQKKRESFNENSAEKKIKSKSTRLKVSFKGGNISEGIFNFVH